MLTLRVLVPVLGIAAVVLLGWPRGAAASPEVTARARAFLDEHTKVLRPLEIESALAWWAANTTGKAENFDRKEKAQNKVDEALGDKGRFARVKALRGEKEAIDDPVLRRAVEVVYLQSLEKQVNPALLRQITAKANAVEKAFNVFRAKVDGQELTDNQVRKVLKESTDSARRRAAWEASKEVGKVVEADLKELVRLRNQAAAELGFKNFHALQLFLNEQDGAALIKLFDELDSLTREPFRAAKAEIDQALAKANGIKVEELRPWHYHDPFFQEVPAVFAADLDAPYRKADIIGLCREFYAGVGLPVDRVLERSDLKERPGKSQHVFCTDIDREGDVRVLANVVPNEQWASTMLHELGHAVYSTNTNNIPASLPYVLRTEAHILTTEGVAMQFERLSKRRGWLEKMGLTLEDPAGFEAAGAKALKYRLLIFSRWCQVMLRFEKAMYEDPGQDLNALWWGLVEKYQLVKRPQGRNMPDYGSKIHIVSAPVYYHNYMMGELFASQVHHAIAREVYGGVDPNTLVYVGDKRVGEFMRKRVFAPGRTLGWSELTKHATGEGLSARAFAADFK